MRINVLQASIAQQDLATLKNTHVMLVPTEHTQEVPLKLIVQLAHLVTSVHQVHQNHLSVQLVTTAKLVLKSHRPVLLVHSKVVLV